MKNSKSENFYQAILQNLFFGTLNQIIEDREFVKKARFLITGKNMVSQIDFVIQI